MEAPRCSKCLTKHWSRESCPSDVKPKTRSHVPPLMSLKASSGRSQMGRKLSVPVVVSPRTTGSQVSTTVPGVEKAGGSPADRKAYLRAYMREYMRKRRAKP